MCVALINNENMVTQLVRLDKPYNIICSPKCKFGLHIATLIFINEVPVKDSETGDVVDYSTIVKSYPVVSEKYGFDGVAWMKSELKDCMVICREGEGVGLYTLKKLMEFSSKSYHFADFLPIIPGALSMALMNYNASLELPTDDLKNTINDYEVELEFSEENGGKSCMVYASKESDFHFYDYFDNEPPFVPEVRTNTETIKYFTELRDSYVRAFHFEGLHSITFTTKSEQYQWFIDKLNGTKADETGV